MYQNLFQIIKTAYFKLQKTCWNYENKVYFKFQKQFIKTYLNEIILNHKMNYFNYVNKCMQILLENCISSNQKLQAYFIKKEKITLFYLINELIYLKGLSTKCVPYNSGNESNDESNTKNTVVSLK